MLIDRALFYPRLLKTSVALAQLAMLWLSYRLFTGGLHNAEASTALLISTFWLGLTTLRLGTLLRSYFDHLSRLQVMVPTAIGVMLSGLALFAAAPVLKLAAALVLVGWLLVYAKYRHNRQLFKRQGHGPMPKEAWVSPDHRALQPGDLILTSGRMAGRLHDTVGHAELVIRGEGGRLHTLSSFMEHGVRIRRLDAVTRKLNDANCHYIALRLRTPLSEEQMGCALKLAEHYRELNDNWRKQANEKRLRFVNALPLPQALRNWLFARIRATGYDWPGLFIGTRPSNRWTCIAVCIAALKEVGVPVGDYGTGMLGLGTGLLDPIQPVRLLGDKAYRLVNLDDKSKFEASI